MLPLVKELPRLIDFIEQRLAAAPKFSFRNTVEEEDAWNDRVRALETITNELTANEGARLARQGDAFTMKLAGVQSSCTSGPHGLLRNWQAAARRSLEAGGMS